MRIRILTSLTVILLFAAVVNGQPVPLGDRAYQLVEQGIARGVLTDATLLQRPLLRGEMARLLVDLEMARRTDNPFPPALNRELSKHLVWYEREINALVEPDWWDDTQTYRPRLHRYSRSWMLEDTSPPGLFSEKGHVLDLSFRNGAWLTADPTYAFRLDHQSGASEATDYSVFRRRWGFVFEAGPTGWMQVFLRWRDVAEWGRGPYYYWNAREQMFDDRVGYLNPNSEDLLAYEDLAGGVIVANGPLSLMLGRDRVAWGPGRYGNVLLGGDMPTFNQVRASAEMGRVVKYTYLHGALHQYPEIKDSLYEAVSGRIRYYKEEKYIAAHRLDMRVTSWLNIGLQEAVVYGERGFDFDYLNPVSVIFSEEHDSGDQDNALMGLDLLFGPFGPCLMWGELVLDDFIFSEIGNNHASNKVGWLLGGSARGPGGRLPIETGIEYAGLRPFMYSHFYPINTYKHWNTSLGLQLEPNSDRTTAWMTWQPSQPFRFGVETHYLRHGENTSWKNVGGDIDLPRNVDSTTTAVFLDGRRQDRFRASLWAEWEVFEHLLTYAMIGQDRFVDYWDHNSFIAAVGFAWHRPQHRPYALTGRH